MIRLDAPSRDDRGFTLIELLVVVIIIGILAAIAIPVFLSQRAHAHDAAVKSDVSTLGKELATYYVDNSATPVLSLAAGQYSLSSSELPPSGRQLGHASNHVGLVNQFISDDTHWCITLTNAKGDKKTFKYSATAGVQAGTCTNANG